MAKTTKKLKDHHRAFLVREFACFATPMEAADALREEYGITITPQSAQHYDVTSGAGARAAKRWHELFDVSRQAFLDDVKARVPESYKAVRVQELARASRTFKKRGNLVGMAAMLEKIAREVGNAYTNRHEVTGKGAGPIQFEDVSTMTDDEIDNELRRLLNVDGTRVQPASESEQ